MKRIFSILIIFIVMFIVKPTFAAEIPVFIDSNKVTFIDATPGTVNGCVMVPMRIIFEKLGAEVQWDNNTKTATAKKGDLVISLSINNEIAKLNGVDKKLDAPPTTISDRMYVPVRFVSEAFGAKVYWNNDTKTVYIYSNGWYLVEPYCKLVGISMPTTESRRWAADGSSLVGQLHELGYKAELQDTNDDAEKQISQIEKMIEENISVLVVAAVDTGSLESILQKAKNKGIIVICYDRLVENVQHIDYFVTFDKFKAGVLQASYIEKALGLKDGRGPFNIELFGGAPDDRY